MEMIIVQYGGSTPTLGPFLEIPFSWPAFPFMPLINTRTRQQGVLVDFKFFQDVPHLRYSVFLIPMHDLPCIHHRSCCKEAVQMVKEKVSHIDYTSWEELKNAGWTH